MRTTILALAFVALSSCSSTGSQPIGTGGTPTAPIRGIVNTSGAGDAQVVYVSPLTGLLVPLTARFAWSHDVRITLQPYPPYVIIDGEAGSIIEPIPGQEPDAQRSLDSGEVLIRRAGIRGGMNRPGSIKARAEGRGAPLPEVDDLGVPPSGA